MKTTPVEREYWQMVAGTGGALDSDSAWDLLLDLAEVIAERDALAIKVDRVRALPLGPPSGGCYMVSMRDVIDALDADGDE